MPLAMVPTFLSTFQVVFDIMLLICLDFKWPGFQISDPIQNPDHLQTNLLLNGSIRISDPHFILNHCSFTGCLSDWQMRLD